MPSDPVLLERCEYDPHTKNIDKNVTNFDNYFNEKSKASSCYYAPECTRIRDPIRGGSVNPDCLLYADVKEANNVELNSGQNTDSDKLKKNVVQVQYPLPNKEEVKNDVGVKVKSNQTGPNVTTKERGSSNFLAYKAEIKSLDDYSDTNSQIVSEALKNIHQANIAVVNKCSILQEQGYGVLQEGDNKCAIGCNDLKPNECKDAGIFCNYKPLAICSKDMVTNPDGTTEKRNCGGNTNNSCGPCVEYSIGEKVVLAFDDPKEGKTVCYDTKDNASANGEKGKIGCENAMYRTIQTEPTDFRVEEKDARMKEWKTIDIKSAKNADSMYACVFGSLDAHKEAIQACKCEKSPGERYDFDDVSKYRNLKQLAVDVYNVDSTAYDDMEKLYATPNTNDDNVPHTHEHSHDDDNEGHTHAATLRRKGYSI